MNYLITGGTGFLGSYVCKQLLEEGHQIVCFDYIPDKNSIQMVLTPDQLSRVLIVQGDIRDAFQLIHVCQRQEIGVIIHLAGLLQADSEKNIPAAIQTNIVGTINVFEAARICGIKRVVWASSNSVFGAPESFTSETIPNDAPHCPQSVYAKCKDAAEYFGHHYNLNYGLETVALRYTVIYGKARLRGGSNWINALLSEPALGVSTEVPNGDDAPNLLYVKDAARATVLATKATKLRRSAYTITGDVITMASLRDYVQSVIPGVEIKLLPGNMGIAWKYETQLEEDELGYKPEYDAIRGAKEVIDLLRAEAGLPSV